MMSKDTLLAAFIALSFNFVIGQYNETNRDWKPGVGGKVVTLGELPHAVVVIATLGKCTGSIIHASWVLTAGHCVSDPRGRALPNSDITIIAGVIDYKSPGPAAQKRIAEQILIYPEYSTETLAKFDLALVKVQPFQLNNYVAVIGFSRKEWPQDRRMLNRTCTSAGWGMLANRQSTSVLHSQTTIAKHGKDSCPCIHKNYIVKRLICLAAESAVGICFGDSGGALVCDGEIVGVAHMVMDKRSCSYFKSPDRTMYCESAYVFGIYMYTCPLLDWIRKQVPGLPPPPASCDSTIFTPISSLIFLLLILVILKQN